MALKALMLRKKIDMKNKDLEALRAKETDFATREAELEQAISEAETDEEQAAVNEAIDTFTAERAANGEAITGLEKEIGELEADLAAEERAQETPAQKEEKLIDEERGEACKMVRRNKFNLNEETMQRSEVAEFIERCREHISQKRAITNAGLIVPEVFMGILRENLINYSKLYKHVNVRYINGEGRMVVMGTVPEAIWTECCANLNEMTLAFNDVEVDCNKVGAYIPVCNAILEDSAIDLATEVLDALAQGIGIALDKAILYGTGTKMPLGVVTRLAQSTAPSDYPATARAWEDLHTTNILSITAANSTGTKLFTNIIKDFGAAKGKYSRGEKVFVMNDKTYSALMAEAVEVNSAGAIVSGVNGSMPVIGGVIEVLDFIPDNVIIGGYFDLYLLAERSAVKLGQSEHVRFVQDQTVFKGTARYDGLPVIAEGFVAIGINATTPTASMTFAADTANS